MIDRALGFGPIQQDSYYFQLIPLSLSIISKESELPAEGTTYRFSVAKGQQKFDENKVPILANFQVSSGQPFMSVSSCKLNFYLPSYNRLRKQEFTLRLVQNERNQDYDIGSYPIDVSQLIESFKKDNKVRYEYKTTFSEDYELAFQIFIEKTRIALEKAVKETRVERVNATSPLNSKVETAQNSPSKVPEVEIPERDQVIIEEKKEYKVQKEERKPSPVKKAKRRAKMLQQKQGLKNHKRTKMIRSELSKKYHQSKQNSNNWLIKTPLKRQKCKKVIDYRQQELSECKDKLVLRIMNHQQKKGQLCGYSCYSALWQCTLPCIPISVFE